MTQDMAAAPTACPRCIWFRKILIAKFREESCQTLYITQALPNPQGKDRPPAGGPSNDQLNGESAVGIQKQFGQTTQPERTGARHRILHRQLSAYWRCHRDLFQSGPSCMADQSIRVHTGSGQGYWAGGIFHNFLGRSNYVWNNRCGDIASLAISGTVIDWALYVGNPTEGKILRRLSDNLLS